ncbi:MAG: GAF domain-containing protein [Candidatus Bipolaricaulia bacterium]
MKDKDKAKGKLINELEIAETQRKQAENRIRSVNRFMRVMNETSDLEELMNVILEQAINMIPTADSGSFLMLNERENVFEFQAARGWDLELLKRIKLPADRTILIQESINEPTIVGCEEIEALNKRYYDPEIVEKLKEVGHPKSSIFIPVYIDGKVIGYFALNSKTVENAFDKEDLRTIEAIRDEITLAIKNARLFEERENSLWELQQRNLELSTLYAITSTVSGSLDLNVILDEALSRAMELTKTKAGVIRLMDESNQELVLTTYQGLSPESIKAFAKERFKLDEGGAGRVAQSGKPLVIQNLTEDPRLVHRELFKKEGLQSGVIIPLKSKDRFIGVLFLGDRTFRLFAEKEVQLLMAIGHQIGVAIENARLYEKVKLTAEELEQQVRQIRRTNRFMRVMNETSNLGELMNVILEQAIDIVPNADSGSVLMLNEAEGILEFQATCGWDLELLKRIEIPTDRSILILKSINKSTIIEGEEFKALHKRHYDPEIMEQFKELEYPKSLIIVPVHIDGKIVGCFIIHSLAVENAFDEEDLNLIEEVRDEITLAIKNARLSKERKRSLQKLQQRTLELSALYEIASMASGSLNLDAILDQALGAAIELMEVECGEIFLIDESNQELVPAVYQGIPSELVEMLTIVKLKLGEGIPGRVAQSGEPIVIQNLAEDPRVAHREIIKKAGLQSEVVIPLKSKQRVTGALLLGTRTTRLFTEEEVQLLMAIGHQIGMAIENIQLYDDLRMKEKQLRSFVNRLIQVQEEERRLVAYDIHDELIQHIISANMYLKTGLKKLRSRARTTEEIQTVLEKGLNQLNQSITEARRIIAALRPSTLDHLGLIPAIQDHLRELQQETGWEVVFEENLEKVRLDPTVEVVVYRIIQEALINAKKHAETDRVRVAIERRSAHLNVEVQDWGTGFDPKELHQADREEDKPLGLIAMQERAKLVGGRFTVESALDQGTTVRAEIPLRRRRITADQDSRPNREITVLIADDHPIVRDGLRLMLDVEGIRIIGEAANGKQTVVKANRLAPDIILMDVRMPEMDGLDALKEIKAENPEIAVIMLTTYDNPSYLLQAVASGAAGYLLKEVPCEELVDAIRRVHDGESLINRSMLKELVEELTQESSKTTPVGTELTQDLLTDREREVLRLVVEGMSNSEIAKVLDISVSTAKTHVEHIIMKLHVSDRVQTAVWAVRHGLA